MIRQRVGGNATEPFRDAQHATTAAGSANLKVAEEGTQHHHPNDEHHHGKKADNANVAVHVLGGVLQKCRRSISSVSARCSALFSLPLSVPLNEVSTVSSPLAASSRYRTLATFSLLWGVYTVISFLLIAHGGEIPDEWWQSLEPAYQRAFSASPRTAPSEVYIRLAAAKDTIASSTVQGKNNMNARHANDQKEREDEDEPSSEATTASVLGFLQAIGVPVTQRPLETIITPAHRSWSVRHGTSPWEWQTQHQLRPAAFPLPFYFFFAALRWAEEAANVALLRAVVLPLLLVGDMTGHTVTDKSDVDADGCRLILGAHGHSVNSNSEPIRIYGIRQEGVTQKNSYHPLSSSSSSPFLGPLLRVCSSPSGAGKETERGVPFAALLGLSSSSSSSSTTSSPLPPPLHDQRAHWTQRIVGHGLLTVAQGYGRIAAAATHSYLAPDQVALRAALPLPQPITVPVGRGEWDSTSPHAPSYLDRATITSAVLDVPALLPSTPDSIFGSSDGKSGGGAAGAAPERVSVQKLLTAHAATLEALRWSYFAIPKVLCSAVAAALHVLVVEGAVVAVGLTLLVPTAAVGTLGSASRRSSERAGGLLPSSSTSVVWRLLTTPSGVAGIVQLTRRAAHALLFTHYMIVYTAPRSLSNVPEAVIVAACVVIYGRWILRFRLTSLARRIPVNSIRYNNNNSSGGSKSNTHEERGSLPPGVDRADVVDTGRETLLTPHYSALIEAIGAETLGYGGETSLPLRNGAAPRHPHQRNAASFRSVLLATLQLLLLGGTGCLLRPTIAVPFALIFIAFIYDYAAATTAAEKEVENEKDVKDQPEEEDVTGDALSPSLSLSRALALLAIDYGQGCRFHCWRCVRSVLAVCPCVASLSPTTFGCCSDAQDEDNGEETARRESGCFPNTFQGMCPTLLRPLLAACGVLGGVHRAAKGAAGGGGVGGGGSGNGRWSNQRCRRALWVMLLRTVLVAWLYLLIGGLLWVVCSVRCAAALAAGRRLVARSPGSGLIIHSANKNGRHTNGTSPIAGYSSEQILRELVWDMVTAIRRAIWHCIAVINARRLELAALVAVSVVLVLGVLCVALFIDSWYYCGSAPADVVHSLLVQLRNHRHHRHQQGTSNEGVESASSAAAGTCVVSVPILNFFTFNFAKGYSAFFGTEPWWFYFVYGLPAMIGSQGIIVGLVLAWRWLWSLQVLSGPSTTTAPSSAAAGRQSASNVSSSPPKSSSLLSFSTCFSVVDGWYFGRLAAIIFGATAVYSVLGHKEVRFIFPVAAPMAAMLAPVAFTILAILDREENDEQQQEEQLLQRRQEAVETVRAMQHQPPPSARPDEVVAGGEGEEDASPPQPLPPPRPQVSDNSKDSLSSSSASSSSSCPLLVSWPRLLLFSGAVNIALLLVIALSFKSGHTSAGTVFRSGALEEVYYRTRLMGLQQQQRQQGAEGGQWVPVTAFGAALSALHHGATTQSSASAAALTSAAIPRPTVHVLTPCYFMSGHSQYHNVFDRLFSINCNVMAVEQLHGPTGHCAGSGRHGEPKSENGKTDSIREGTARATSTADNENHPHNKEGTSGQYHKTNNVHGCMRRRDTEHELIESHPLALMADLYGLWRPADNRELQKGTTPAAGAPLSPSPFAALETIEHGGLPAGRIVPTLTPYSAMLLDAATGLRGACQSTPYLAPNFILPPSGGDAVGSKNDHQDGTSLGSGDGGGAEEVAVLDACGFGGSILNALAERRLRQRLMLQHQHQQHRNGVLLRRDEKSEQGTTLPTPPSIEGDATTALPDVLVLFSWLAEAASAHRVLPLLLGPPYSSTDGPMDERAVDSNNAVIAMATAFCADYYRSPSSSSDHVISDDHQHDDHYYYTLERRLHHTFLVTDPGADKTVDVWLRRRCP